MILLLLGLALPVAADNSEFRLLVSTNSAVVGGDFNVDVQIKVTDGSTAPRSLNSLTVDVEYGSSLSAYTDTCAVNWALSSGYEATVSKLAGYYRPADSKKNRTLIILVHGWRDHPSDMGAYAQMILSKTDCHILIPHLRAHGMSQGRFIGYGLYDSQDLVFWVRFMERRLGESLKIILFGRSMGATAALLAAASRKLPSSVAGVIADSPYDSLENQLIHRLRQRYHVPGRQFFDLVRRIAESRIGFPVKRASIPSVASRIKLPVLLIHGSEDTFVPPEMSENIFDRLACPKRLVMVEKAKHVMAFDASPRNYSDEIEKFLKMCKVM